MLMRKPWIVFALGCVLWTQACGSTGDDNDPATDEKGGTIKVTLSGEAFAQSGYPFPPQPGDELVFVDGWEVSFDHVLVTVGDVHLYANPDTNAQDPTQVGPEVAHMDGSWVVNLARAGDVPGKGGGSETAFTLGTLTNQDNGQRFDPESRYALSFRTLAASASAQKVNLDAASEALYTEMIAAGQSVLYAGTARFRGTQCSSTDNSYAFASLPTEVHFKLGFTAPTRYSNCQNPENAPAEPLAGEEFQRGVQVRANAEAVAQLTIHVDHPFWESTAEDAPLHFDPWAARAVMRNGRAEVNLADVATVDFTQVQDTQGNALPWRWCIDDYVPPTAATTVGFNARNIPFNPQGNPTQSLRGLADYATYLLSTQGHLNADGLCAVERDYVSPP